MLNNSIFKRDEVEILITNKSHGSMHNKGRALSKINSNLHLKKIVFMKQVHGNVTSFVDLSSPGVILDTDGIITNKQHIALCALTADCLPIFIYDPKNLCVGVVHAGYKGILKGVIEEATANFVKKASKVTDLLIGIGPSIGVCCYSVSRERVGQFQDKFAGFEDIYSADKGRYFLDLKSVAKQILVNSGVNSKNIDTMPVCTSCNNNIYYSYRKKAGGGVFASVIMMN